MLCNHDPLYLCLFMFYIFRHCHLIMAFISNCVDRVMFEAPDPHEEDEPHSKCPDDVTTASESEILHRKNLKVDTNGLINDLRINLVKKSRLQVPLCRMLVMDEVRAVGELDVQRLESEFVNGYREGDRVLYISAFNNLDVSCDVTDEIVQSWSPIWRKVNDEFEEELAADDDLAQLRGKMFYVWDGNHRVTAWTRHITKFHVDEEGWHYRVHCIVLDPRGSVARLLNAMSDVNWYNVPPIQMNLNILVCDQLLLKLQALKFGGAGPRRTTTLRAPFRQSCVESVRLGYSH